MRKWSVLRLSMPKPSRTDPMTEKLCPDPALALPQKAKAARGSRFQHFRHAHPMVGGDVAQNALERSDLNGAVVWDDLRGVGLQLGLSP